MIECLCPKPQIAATQVRTFRRKELHEHLAEWMLSQNKWERARTRVLLADEGHEFELVAYSISFAQFGIVIV
jgi:hypothetical protein